MLTCLKRLASLEICAYVQIVECNDYRYGANAFKAIGAHEKAWTGAQVIACALKSCPTNTPTNSCKIHTYECSLIHTHRHQHYIYLKMINAKNSKWVSERWWSTQKQFQWVRIIRTGSVFFRCSSAEPHTNKIKSAQRKMCKQRAALAINVSYDQCIFCPSIWFEQ